MAEESNSERIDLALLSEIELILESDRLLDEVGFIHPSQFPKLDEDSLQFDRTISSGTLQTITFDRDNLNFWSRDHKLGISTQVVVPLYKAAKHAFMAAFRQYKMLCSSTGEENEQLLNALENDAMKHSRILLLISSDFGTAWNFRKLVLSKKEKLANFLDELQLSALVLSYSPKSENAWSHRRWLIRMIDGKCSTLQHIVGRESELVEKIAEISKMNYRAWHHRCWLVSYLKTEQVLHELKRSRIWAGLHIADNCCFHYRRRLMLMMYDNTWNQQETESSDYNAEIYHAWKDELDWDEVLIKRYIGREALWLHRRFLSLYWIKHFANDAITTFLDNELHLLQSCLTIQDSEFEDFQSQAIYSATYMLWLMKQIPECQMIDLRQKVRTLELESMLNLLCPGKSSLWDSLMH